MVAYEQILKLGKQIATEFAPERISLFGSYAYGTPTEDSDIDLLVVMPFKGRRHKEALAIRRRLPPYLPLDLVVRTPKELRQRLQWGDYFLHEIMEKGKVLYEAAHDPRFLPVVRNATWLVASRRTCDLPPYSAISPTISTVLPTNWSTSGKSANLL